jgi:hypothetical protein
MKIISGTEDQIKTLRYLFPEHRISSYVALVPASEYYFWTRRFNNLLDSLSGHLYPLNLRLASKIPIIQCVAKFVGLNTDNYLIPKAFKFRTLPEGTLKGFGYSSKVVPLLDTLSDSLPYPIMKFPFKSEKTTCLGFMSWDSKQPPTKQGDRNLVSFVPCASPSSIGDIEIAEDRKLIYEGREYTHLLPTNNYYEHKKFQALLTRLHELKMLVLPLNSPFDNLKKLVGFTDPCWAEVKPLDFFLEEDPDNLDKYVLIRTDDGKIVTWGEVMQTPALRLELEMSEYWFWQEACNTDKALENLNLYWEFGLDYPWLIDKRDNSFVPVFIVEN